MGCGASVNQEDPRSTLTRKLSSESMEDAENQLASSVQQLAPTSPGGSPVESRQTSPVLNPEPSERSQKSIKISVSASPNGSERRTSLRDLNNNSGRASDDVLLPSIGNQLNKLKSKSSSSSRTSSTVFPPPISRLQTGSNSLLSNHTHSHQKSATVLNGKIGRCSHCPHCRRAAGGKSISTSPQPKWISEHRGSDQAHIIMDEYDVEAVKEKMVSENGHLPGSYDYQPNLIMEQTNHFDEIKENYYTHPFIVKTKPRISATCTPFPEYTLLQRRDQRVNKPYTLPLFD